MPATKLRCRVCGTEFYGRSDACYCRGACRQKAYRARIARGSANPGRGRSGEAARSARQLRGRAQAAREEADVIRRKAAALLDSFRR